MAEDGKKKRGLSAEQWAEAKQLYWQGMPIDRIAKHFGKRWNTIDDRAKREGWTVDPTVDLSGSHRGKPIGEIVQERAQSKVIDLASRRVVDKAVESGAVDRMAEATVAADVNYAELEALMLEYAKDTLQRALGQVKDDQGNIIRLRAGTHTSEAGERKDAMAAAGLAIDKSRELRGKRVGDASIKPDGDDSGEVSEVKITIVDARRNGTTGEAT